MGKRLVTHLAIHGDPILPSSGLRKLYFYTRLEENPNEYSFGTDNIFFSEQEMARRSVIKLPEEVELFEKKGLWVDKDGNIFYADLVTPSVDKQLLFKCEELVELNNKTLRRPT